MAIVAIAALDFAAFRALFFDFRTPLNANRLDLLAMGALPMANVLAVGFLIGLRRHKSRPFLWGFMAFGAAALVLYLVVWSFYADAWVENYLVLVHGSLRKVVGRLRPDIFDTIFYISDVVFLLGWPQMAFALIGGFLSRKF